MPNRLKAILSGTLGARPVGRMLRSSLHDAVPIFMLHRFSDPTLGIEGHSSDDLRRDLAYLRRNGYQLSALGNLVTNRETSRRQPKVVFTIDDGYSDFLNVALPVFAEFDCPVTVFVATGVVDGAAWFWWDKLTYVFGATSRRDMIGCRVNDAEIRFDLQSTSSRSQAAQSMIELCKTIPDPIRIELLARIARDLEVDVPETPPAAFAPMSWSDIATCSATGLVSFGPHTITHPALTMTTQAQGHGEIEGSWHRLREQCGSAIPILCFPFGSFSQREVEIVQSTELIGACTTEHLYARPDVFSLRGTVAPFMVPRFAYPGTRLDFLQIVTGFERVKMAVRHGLSGWTSAVFQPQKRELAQS